MTAIDLLHRRGRAVHARRRPGLHRLCRHLRGAVHRAELRRPRRAFPGRRGRDVASDRPGPGAGLGLVEGALLASVGIVVVTTYTADPLLGAATQLGLLPDIAGVLEVSTIARILSDTTVPFVPAILGPLLPSDITSIAEMLPGAE